MGMGRVGRVLALAAAAGLLPALAGAVQDSEKALFGPDTLPAGVGPGEQP